MSKKKSSEDMATGVVVINKHEGVTSFRIVQIMKKLYDTPRVGHTGTLDPMATGVLPVLVGRAVKAAEYIVAQDKEYIAEMTLGLTTDTEDITGEVLSECDDIPSEKEVTEAVNSFVGEIEQLPPMYSAIKIGGQKLVDIARDGGTVERKPRKVTVESIKTEKINDKLYRLSIKCTKGTYVRSLCRDIGEKLGCGAVMSKLERTRSGNYTLDNALTLDEISEMSKEERIRAVTPTDSLFAGSPEIEVNDFYLKLFRGGTELYQKKLHTDFDIGTLVRVYHNGIFIGLGKVKDFDNGTAVKPEKLFVL